MSCCFMYAGILLLQHADRRRRAEHRPDLVLGDDLPPDRGIGTDRQAFVEDRRRAVDQRRVDDVRVADDPADVARREHRLARRDAEDPAHRRRERDRVAAGVALHALRLAGRARRVEDVRRLGRLEPLAGHLRIHVAGPQRRVVEVAAGDDRHRRIEAAVDDDDPLRRMRGEPDRLVDQVLVRDRPCRRASRRRRSP